MRLRSIYGGNSLNRCELVLNRTFLSFLSTFYCVLHLICERDQMFVPFDCVPTFFLIWHLNLKFLSAISRVSINDLCLLFRCLKIWFNKLHLFCIWLWRYFHIWAKTCFWCIWIKHSPIKSFWRLLSAISTCIWEQCIWFIRTIWSTKSTCIWYS